MTNWEKLRNDICDYIDGLLPIEARKEIDRQLHENREAEQFYKQVSELRAQLRSLRPIKTSPDFDTVLRTRIRMERSLSRRGWLSDSVRVPVAVTVGALAVVTIVFLFNISNLNNNQAPMRSSAFPSYSASQVDSRNGVNNGPPVHYVPVDQFIPHGGSPIDRLGTVDDRARPDSASRGMHGSPIMQVEVEF